MEEAKGLSLLKMMVNKTNKSLIEQIRKHMWVNDTEHAWVAFLNKINRKYEQLDIELKAEYHYGMIMVVSSAVSYFKQTELLLLESRNEEKVIQPCTPEGMVFDIKYQQQQNFAFARKGLAEYYLLPKTAVEIKNFNDKGYCKDLVWAFDWEDRMI